MFKGFTAVMYKEFIQVGRDPVTLFLMLFIPMLQLLLFGYAIDMNVRDVPTVVYDLDRSQQSRELIDSFVNTGYFKIVGYVASDRDLNSAIVRGEAKVGIKVPSRYSDDLLWGRPAQVLVLIDGSDSTVATQVLTVSNAVGLRLSSGPISDAAVKNGSYASGLSVDVRPRLLFNPDSRTANFMVPGLVGIIMQNVTVLLTAFAIVRERERGTLEQLLVTPIKPFGLMFGKLVPYAAIGFVEMCSVVVVMRFVFGVPINGSPMLLICLASLFLFPALGIGLLISTKASNQMQAMQIGFAIMLPSIFFSGFIFPRESMPPLISWIGLIIPATHLLEIVRGIVLRGATLADLWSHVVVLVAMGVLLLAASALRFRKKIA